METIDMKIERILCLSCLSAEMTAVDECVGEMNSLDMVHNVVFLSVCLPTQNALEHWAGVRHHLRDVPRENAAIVSCKLRVIKCELRLGKRATQAQAPRLVTFNVVLTEEQFSRPTRTVMAYGHLVLAPTDGLGVFWPPYYDDIHFLGSTFSFFVALFW